MRVQRTHQEVFVATDPVVRVDRKSVERLKALGTDTPRRRVRLCAHRDSDDPLHEMLIVLAQSTYIRPHRHKNKSESFHIVAGALDVVIFEDDGSLREVVSMGDFASGRSFYYRLAEPAYHAVLLRSELAVFHETTNGPFDRNDTEFAPWAPPDADADAARRYLSQLEAQVDRLRPNGTKRDGIEAEEWEEIAV